MLKGIGASRGAAVGTALVIKERPADVQEKRTDPIDPKTELAGFENAVQTFCAKTEKMAQKLDETGASGEILRGHILMLKDPFMLSQITEQIQNKISAVDAVTATCNMFAEIFAAADDELTRQRAADVQDIKTRLIHILNGEEETDLSDLPENTVLVVGELTPSMTAGMDSAHVCAIVTEKGGKTSHCAILARAMRIPAVLSAAGVTESIQTGDLVAVNGGTGEVQIAPDAQTVAAFEKLKAEFAEKEAVLQQFKGKPTVTADGKVKELFANIGSDRDVQEAMENDAEGIGLFRTEFLFMDRNALPTEEEQFSAYRAAVTGLKGKPLIIRTLDIGGDKEIPYLGLKKEENPFLGFRAVRYCLQNTDVFKTQLRAILRASAFGDIRIMLPLVTCVEEVENAKALLHAVQEELIAEKIEFNKEIPIGVMIETPAACLIADLLSRQVDFFSIGTNDLTQYIMAADRGNADVEYLYSVYQPAVLRGIQHIIACAKEAGIPAGMCGEAAADPYLIPLLVAFGLDEFSVSSNAVLEVREQISRWTVDAAHEIADKALALQTEQQVREYLKTVV